MRFLLVVFLFTFLLDAKDVYIFKSNSTLKKLKELKIDEKSYLQNIKFLQDELKAIGYESQIISENGLRDLNGYHIIIMPDTIFLDYGDSEDVVDFVKDGGGLIFNFNCAFNQEDDFINKISNFKYYKNFTHIDLTKNRAYLTPKILSPITTYLKSGERLDFINDKKLPIFKTPKESNPDLVITNLFQNNLPKNSKIQDAGAVWHGELKKGRWVYFNFPLSTILNSSQKKSYQNLLKGMVEYLQNKPIIKKFPYIDSQNAVLLYETLTYKQDSLNSLVSLANRLKFPFTTFHTASHLSKNPKSLVKAINSKYIEIASAGYSNRELVGVENQFIKRETIGSKNLIDSIMQNEKRIYGFAPTQNRLDSTVIQYLKNGNYGYFIYPNSAMIYPNLDYSPLTAIPKTATDDKQFMVKLGWSDKKILETMKNQIKLLSYLNGVYSFNFHSHIMGYYLNLDLIEEFIEFVEKKNYKPFLAKSLAQTIIRVNKIDINIKKQSLNLYKIEIDNKNYKKIKNFTFRIYPQSGKNLKALFSNNLFISYFKQKNNEYDVIIKKLKSKKKYKIIVEF